MNAIPTQISAQDTHRILIFGRCWHAQGLRIQPATPLVGLTPRTFSDELLMMTLLAVVGSGASTKKTPAQE
jgi:hypothetical protein